MVPDLGIGVGGPPQAAKAGRPGGRVEREAGGRTWCPHLHAVGFILKLNVLLYVPSWTNSHFEKSLQNAN